jgi:putative transposase
VAPRHGRTRDGLSRSAAGRLRGDKPAVQVKVSLVRASTASRICAELRERYPAFRQRDLSQIELVALYLDAIYLAVRPTGVKEGVLCAWGIDRDGKRVLLDVCLGQRELDEDCLELGRGLTARGLRSPLLVIADGAPGLVNAI